MLEAKLAETGMLKKLLDSIKELVTDANFECNEEGINLQAMDNSHVALVAVHLQAAGFKRFRCDRPMPLGVNLGSLTKVLKCAKDDDECTLKAADEADVLNLVYEAKNSDRIAEYDMKLMDIDSDTLGIPDTEYEAEVSMPSAEFARIVRDLSALGESVRIEVSKEGVRFASEGESANGSILLKKDGEVGRVKTAKEKKAEKARANGEEPEEDEEEEEEENEDGEKPKKVKKEKVKKEKGDEDVEMEDEEKDEEAFKANSDDEDEKSEPSDDEESGKKRKKKTNGSSKPAKKAKTTKSKGKGKKDDEEKTVFDFSMNSHVSLTFSLKYLVNFAKSTSMTNKVELRLSNDVPLLVDYDFGQGYVRYYLAPKIGDE